MRRTTACMSGGPEQTCSEDSPSIDASRQSFTPSSSPILAQVPRRGARREEEGLGKNGVNYAPRIVMQFVPQDQTKILLLIKGTILVPDFVYCEILVQ